MPSITPLSVRHLSLHEAQACTLIAQRAQQLPWHALNCDWWVDLTCVEHRAETASEAWFFQFEWSGGRFELSVPLQAAAEWLAAAQLYDPLQPLPEALAALILEAAFIEAFEALRPLGRGVPQLLEVETTRAASPEYSHALQVSVSLAGSPAQVVALSLKTDSMGLLSLAGAVGRRAARRQALRDDLPVPLRVQLGRSTLQASEMGHLAPGDVLLLQDCLLDSHHQFWLLASTTHGVLVQLANSPFHSADATHTETPDAEPVQPAPLRLLIIQAWSSFMSGSAATLTATSSDDPLTSVDALPVQLSFDLGELSLTLAQLRELAPGQVLDIARPLQAAVNVRANGVLVAQGDLVSVDGRLGVSLQQVYVQAAQLEGEE